MVSQSFIHFESEKESILLSEDRKLLFSEIADKAAQLSALLSRTRYDLEIKNRLHNDIYPFIEKLITENGGTPYQNEKVAGVFHDLIPPLSIELASLVGRINNDLQSGAYKDNTSNFINLYGKKYNVNAAVGIKQLSRKGIRTHFYKQLAHNLKRETGNRRGVLVADTTNIIFNDLPELTPKQVYKV